MFLGGSSSLEHQLVALNPASNQVNPLFDRKEIFGQFSISPDGGSVAVEVVNNQLYDIQILDLKRSRLSSFTNSEHNYTPIWSPDGSKIYYTSNRENLAIFELYEFDFTQRKEKKIELEGPFLTTVGGQKVSPFSKILRQFLQYL